jgi:(p)ppGpp synthase/HD superfamily hydrolase
MTGAFALQGVAEERERKIRSVFTDQVNYELESFRDSLRALALKDTDLERVNLALEVNLREGRLLTGINQYYVCHPLRTARFICVWLKEANSIRVGETVAAALLHNVLEKEFLDEVELRAQFGPWIADAIVALTLDREAHKLPENCRAFYERLGLMDREVRALKLFDKFDNLHVICIHPNAAVREAYIDEIEIYVRPYAKELVPWLLSYFDELAAHMRALGFYRPEFGASKGGRV